ncbi:hypothetical protein M2480_001894 [Parabacteroides sp. PFB2-12]|nr:hypothetical protein [Parabacteroides sp. PM6-13]MDH6390907.1 hypothetical protein [Parabacteroides sp. PFB2-12]
MCIADFIPLCWLSGGGLRYKSHPHARKGFDLDNPVQTVGAARG